MSFSVKSSHKFINPPAPTQTCTDLLSTSSSPATKKPEDTSELTSNTNTTVKSGSTTGMAMRTNQVALEDYY